MATTIETSTATAVAVSPKVSTLCKSIVDCTGKLGSLWSELTDLAEKERLRGVSEADFRLALAPFGLEAPRVSDMMLLAFPKASAAAAIAAVKQHNATAKQGEKINRNVLLKAARAGAKDIAAVMEVKAEMEQKAADKAAHKSTRGGRPEGNTPAAPSTGTTPTASKPDTATWDDAETDARIDVFIMLALLKGRELEELGDRFNEAIVTKLASTEKN